MWCIIEILDRGVVVSSFQCGEWRGLVVCMTWMGVGGELIGRTELFGSRPMMGGEFFSPKFFRWFGGGKKHRGDGKEFMQANEK